MFMTDDAYTIDEYINKAVEVRPICKFGRYSWPFSKMKLHDSVIITGDAARRAQVTAGVCQHQTGMRFVTRTLYEGSVMVARVA